MKRCTCCGREYADEVDLCVADGMILIDGCCSGEVPPRLARASAPPVLVQSGIAAPPELRLVGELEQRILDGGRFVVFQHCFSVVVMSFKRSSQIVYIPPGGAATGPAIANSLISLLAGWWGIPWGPIWTIGSVIKNAAGGTDVTQAVLVETVGAARAAQVMAQRRKIHTTSCGMKLFRAGLICLVALPLLFYVGSILMAASRARATHSGRATTPGEAQFRVANNALNGNQGYVGCGNSPQAVNIAEDFSNKLKRRRELLFEAAKPSRISAGSAEFVSCCELLDSTCAIIVHVPDLRQFSSEAKDSLGELAWNTAQEVLSRNGAAKPGMKLAVGIRGVVLYDRVLVGNIVTNLEGADSGLIETVTGSEPQRSLHPFFATPTTVPGSNGAKGIQVQPSGTETAQ